MYRARAFLREQHQQMLLQQLQKLEERKRQLGREKEAKRAARRQSREGASVRFGGVGFWCVWCVLAPG